MNRQFFTVAVAVWIAVGTTAGMAQVSTWSAKTAKAPGKISEVLYLGSGIHLDVGREGAEARYYRVHFDGDEINLESLPHFLIAPSEHRAGMLPDGIISRYGKGIEEAWLTGPTGRYGHGVIGDAIEASGLGVMDDRGVLLDLQLPADSVFEDRYPRFADLDGDGIDEILLVRSYLDLGAALAVIKIRQDGLEIIAENKPIGRPNRWLNPAGTGDFDGDGRVEVAIIVTPHIGGILRTYELTGDGLRLEAEGSGFSNHFIGSRELGMSAVLYADGVAGADLAVPSDDRRSLRIIAVAEGRVRDIARVRHEARINSAIHAADLDGDGKMEIVYGLDDATLVVLSR